MHTPGPWETSVLADGSQWEVCLPDAGDAIAGIVDGPDAQDNALLMAAAPDLLAALQFAVSRVELANAEGNPILSAWLSDARAAIARATPQN
jgi:hypothetical protein